MQPKSACKLEFLFGSYSVRNKTNVRLVQKVKHPRMIMAEYLTGLLGRCDTRIADDISA